MEYWNGGVIAEGEQSAAHCKFVQNCENLCKAKLGAEWGDGILEEWKVGMTAKARGGKR